ncbi:hypothetical protein ACXVUM_20100 [Williamsia sp. SKLECPSW1]
MTGDDHDDGLLRDPAGATTVLDDSDGDTDRDAGPRAARRDRGGASTRTRGTRSPAAQRALDRRRRRTVQRSTATLVGRPQRSGGLARLLASPADALRRMPFAVLVIGILAVGLALTLWLSTTAAEDSYGLSDARQQNAAGAAQLDALKKSWESFNAAPQLAKKAGELGMIPAKDVARMVVGPDGKIRIVGEPEAAAGAPAPALNDGAQRTVAPQPGSSTDGNTAQAPAPADTPGAGDPVVAPAPNVLPGSSAPAAAPQGTSTTPDSTAPAATAPANPAPATQAPPGTQAGQSTAGTSGSTDSSVPR